MTSNILFLGVKDQTYCPRRGRLRGSSNNMLGLGALSSTVFHLTVMRVEGSLFHLHGPHKYCIFILWTPGVSYTYSYDMFRIYKIDVDPQLHLLLLT